MARTQVDLPLELDLDAVLVCLGRALDLAEELHGTRTRVDDPRKSNAHLARISNDLRRAADLAGTAVSELHMVYWQVKGHEDPRRGELE